MRDMEVVFPAHQTADGSRRPERALGICQVDFEAGSSPEGLESCGVEAFGFVVELATREERAFIGC